MVVLVVSVVISQAAATSFIHMVMLAASQASHNMRKTRFSKGANGERRFAGRTGASLMCCQFTARAVGSVPFGSAARLGPG